MAEGNFPDKLSKTTPNDISGSHFVLYMGFVIAHSSEHIWRKKNYCRKNVRIFTSSESRILTGTQNEQREEKLKKTKTFISPRNNGNNLFSSKRTQTNRLRVRVKSEKTLNVTHSAQGV